MRYRTPAAGAVRDWIDLHAHLLPGLDDGASTIAATVELARELRDAGARVAAATPHVSGRYPTTPAQLEDGLADARAALAEAEVELELVQGAELALDRLDALDDETLAAFALGPGRRYLLLEFPTDAWPEALPPRLEDLWQRGFGAVLAHPERNQLVQAAPQRLAGLVDAGALVQLTARSLRSRRGAATAAAQSLARSGLAHLLSSDVHRPGAAGSVEAAAALLPDPLVGWLTRDVPEAILAGEQPPPRPRLRRRRSRLLRP